jgi:hypothetical protein
MNAKNDPTLRPGDMVATNGGLMAFKGMKDQTAEFTPVQGKLAQVLISPAAANAHAEAPPPQDEGPKSSNGKRRAQTR